MFGSYNNQSIRKLVIAFGSLFDELYVTRKNDTTGVVENVKVPITFSSKEKFLKRLDSNSSITDNVKTQINLPYMSFEVSNILYDTARKRNKLTTTTQVITEAVGGIENSYKTFSETPIIVAFNVYFYSRSLNEIFQIVEQIMPYFNPEFNIRMNFNKIFENVNVPISYREFRLIDDYEGALNNRRMTIGVISFTAASYVFGEIKPVNVIEDVIDDTVLDPDDDSDDDGTTDPVIPATEIRINTNFGISTYFLPISQNNFRTDLSWAEISITALTTNVSIITEANRLLYTVNVPANTLQLSAEQVTEAINSICTELNICGLDNGVLRKLKVVITNGTTVASKGFRAVMDCTTICP